MTLRFTEICIDAHDVHCAGRVVVAGAGLASERDADGDVVLALRQAPGRTGCSSAVPEDKVVKNRIHFDFRPDDQQAEVDRVVALGARHVDIGQGDESWVVLADPEGNEFCILAAANGRRSRHTAPRFCWNTGPC